MEWFWILVGTMVQKALWLSSCALQYKDKTERRQYKKSVHKRGLFWEDLFHIPFLKWAGDMQLQNSKCKDPKGLGTWEY